MAHEVRLEGLGCISFLGAAVTAQFPPKASLSRLGPSKTMPGRAHVTYEARDDRVRARTSTGISRSWRVAVHGEDAWALAEAWLAEHEGRELGMRRRLANSEKTMATVLLLRCLCVRLPFILRRKCGECQCLQSLRPAVVCLLTISGAPVVVAPSAPAVAPLLASAGDGAQQQLPAEGPPVGAPQASATAACSGEAADTLAPLAPLIGPTMATVAGEEPADVVGSAATADASEGAGLEAAVAPDGSLGRPSGDSAAVASGSGSSDDPVVGRERVDGTPASGGSDAGAVCVPASPPPPKKPKLAADVAAAPPYKPASEREAAMLRRADEVSRLGQYWGFFDWLMWSYASNTKVFLWFGDHPVDIWECFCTDSSRPDCPTAKVLHAAACFGHAPASGLVPRVNHFVLLEPFGDMPPPKMDISDWKGHLAAARMHIEPTDAAHLAGYYMDFGFAVVFTAANGDCAPDTCANFERRASDPAAWKDMRLRVAHTIRSVLATKWAQEAFGAAQEMPIGDEAHPPAPPASAAATPATSAAGVEAQIPSAGGVTSEPTADGRASGVARPSLAIAPSANAAPQHSGGPPPQSAEGPADGQAEEDACDSSVDRKAFKDSHRNEDAEQRRDAGSEHIPARNM